MKAEGEQVTLTMHWSDGPPPIAGDFLRTSTGRCYRIDEMSATVKRTGSVRLRCTVLAGDAVQHGEPGVFGWRWASRTRRTSRTGRR